MNKHSSEVYMMSKYENYELAVNEMSEDELCDLAD